jgi:hypothetical protein
MTININNVFNQPTTTTPVNPERPLETKHPVNLMFMVRGFLAHDAKIYHATCPTCGGLYSLYETTTCAKCRGKLDLIRTEKGVAMAIGELTFYPAIGREQEGRDAKTTRGKKGGVLPVYRVKMFSFADENGDLPNPHPEFLNLRKGVMVEITCYNHQPIFTVFDTKEGGQKVEVMLYIYEGYKDSLTILRGAKERVATTSYDVNPDGSPAPVTTSQPAQPVAVSPDNVSEIMAKLSPADLQTLMSMVKNIQSGQVPASIPAEPNPAPETMVVSNDIPFPS